MRYILIILYLSVIPACGDDGCTGVDTSQAPDSISYSSNNGQTIETRTWGTCSKTYTYNK